MARRTQYLSRIISALVVAVIGIPVLASPADAGKPVGEGGGYGPCVGISEAASVDDFDQWQNLQAAWDNGALNRTHSSYSEGDWVAHRLSLSNVDAGPHYVDVTYDILKNGKFAYDALRPGSSALADGSSQTAGVTITSITELNRPTDAQLLAKAANGDTFTIQARITFTSTAPANSTIKLRFDAHISSELDWQWPGASSISGAPYHVSLDYVDCVGAGQRDNQLMANAIRGGMVKVVKDVTPGTDPQDFTFTITRVDDSSQSYGFTLDDDGNNTNTYSNTFGPYFAAPTQWRISETGLASLSGWDLSSISCDGGSPQVSLGTQSVVITVPDQSGTALANRVPITCTFTNRQFAGPTGSVNATPQFDRDYDWSIVKNLAQNESRTKYFPDGGTTPTFDYSVLVTKSAAHDSNYRLSGTFSITNGNPVVMTGVTPAVTAGSGTCSATRTDSYTVATTIAANGGTANYSFSCTGMTSASGTVSVTTSYTVGSLTSTNQAIGSAGYAFTTPTTVTDDSVTVSDNRVDLNGAAAGTSVTVDSTQTLVYSWTPSTANQAAGTCDDYTNTASYATGTTNEPNDTGSDSETVTVCKGADLTVSKNADPKLTRTYPWEITKTVDDGDQYTGADGDATFNYTVTVTPRPYTDSAWQMKGSITVTNPNPWAVTLTGVTDTPTIAGLTVTSCTVDTTNGLTVPARVGATNGTKTYAYTCILTQDSDPATTVDYDAAGNKNTATATWNAATAHTPTGTDSGEFAVTKAMWEDRVVDAEGDWVMTEINRYVDVLDALAPQPPYVGGVLDDNLDWIAVAASPTGTKVYNYSLTIEDVAVGTCEELANTARVTPADDRQQTLGSAQQTVKACNAGGPTVSKSLTTRFERDHGWEIQKSALPDTQTVPDGQKATFDYVVEVKASQTDSAYTADGSVTISNPNDFQAMTVTATETLAGCTFDENDAASITKTLAEKGETGDSVTLDISCAWDTKPTATTNVVNVTQRGVEGTTPATAAVTWGAPAVERDAVVTVTDVADAENGARAPFDVTYTEYVAGADADGWYEVAEYSLDWTGVPTACTDYDNTASVWPAVNGELEEPVAVEPFDTSTATVEVCTPGAITGASGPNAAFQRDYNWSIAKSNGNPDTEIPAGSTETVNYTVTVTEVGFVDSGFALGGTVTATNPNKFGTTVVDYQVTSTNGATCTVTDGSDLTLPNATESATTPVPRSFTCSFGPGQPTKNGSGQYVFDVTFKVLRDGTGEVLYTESDTVTASVTELDRTVNVTDSRNGGAAAPVDTITFGEDGPTYTYQYSVPVTPDPGECETERNTASYLALNGATELAALAAAATTAHTPESGSASTSVTICALAPLQVAGEAAGDYDRRYNWAIAKEADQTLFTGFNGDADTVTYTVTVTQVDFTDSGWALEGAVTVTNPNSFRAITVDSVAVAGAGAACAVDVSGGLSVAADGSATYPFECTWADQPAYDGSLTATVVGEGSTVPQTIAAPLTLDEEFDRTVTVTDPMFGTEPLGTLTWTEEGLATDLTYTHDVTLPESTCETIDNTATIVETEQSATESVELCGTPPPLPPNPPQPPPRPPVVIPPEAPLPNTGAPTGTAGLTWAGGLLVALGMVLTLSTRTSRRRRLVSGPGRS